MVPRFASLPRPGKETFFLWGPRQTGKSTLLRASYPEALWIDLLQADQFRLYAHRPERLRQSLQQASGRRPYVVIDEIQKVPALLDEVHWMIENMGLRFALCGSSARRVRHGQANLLGGRALRYELFGLSAAELGKDWDLVRMLNRGYLPAVYLSDRAWDMLDGYVTDYLREELAAEGRMQSLPVFADFLNAAAIGDTEPVNLSALGRECGVSHHTVRGYYQILVDTLQGRWLPAYRRRPKRRIATAPKFYFADVGVVNVLTHRRDLAPGSELFGKAFENWVHHELQAYNAYRRVGARLSFWRLSSGAEVDFIVDDMDLAIEAKSSRAVTDDHLRGLRSLVQDHKRVGRRIVIGIEQRAWRTSDGIEVLPAGEFVRRLWAGELF
jgi:predicted AAA+ superfamily ATPase